MLLIDRYLLRIFCKVLLVSFGSLTGLFIVVDAFNNLDEFIVYGERLGGIFPVLWDYYPARVLQFFDRTAGLLALVAGMVSLAWIQRTNELTALMAAGIPKIRVVRPLALAAILISAAGIVNRELLIPPQRDKLTRNAQNWLGENATRLTPREDFNSGIIFNGREVVVADQAIVEPSLLLPSSLNHFSRHVGAARARYCQPTEQRPGGYWLEEVSVPVDVDSIPSATLNGQPVILTRHDHAWLGENQAFVVSQVPLDQLAAGRLWYQFASTWQLIANARNPSLEFADGTLVTIHSRLVQPLLDVTLFFLGIPLVLSRRTRNVFVAAGLCLIVVAVFFVVVFSCHTLGSHSELVAPALAAWSPLMIFVPIAFTIAYRKWE